MAFVLALHWGTRVPSCLTAIDCTTTRCSPFQADASTIQNDNSPPAPQHRLRQQCRTLRATRCASGQALLVPGDDPDPSAPRRRCSRPLNRRVQHPEHPEIRLHILDRRAEPVGGRQEQAATILGSGGDDTKKVGVHGEALVLACSDRASRSRIHCCIHDGTVCKPDRRSSRIALPWLESCSSRMSLA